MNFLIAVIFTDSPTRFTGDERKSFGTTENTEARAIQNGIENFTTIYKTTC